MLFPVSMKPPVATPGAGKAYSIEKGTLTLYIKRKTHPMLAHWMGFICSTTKVLNP
jgi:hypothetical protein